MFRRIYLTWDYVREEDREDGREKEKKDGLRGEERRRGGSFGYYRERSISKMPN